MRRFPRRWRQQALAGTECQVGVQAQRSGGLGTDDAAELFEQGMGIDVAERPDGFAMPIEPAAKGVEAELAALRHLQRFEELAVAQEFGFLCRVVIAVGVVQGARRLRQVGRLGDIEHPAMGFAQLGQRDGRLARAGRADQHHGRRQAPHGFLGVVEDDGLVEQFELGARGVQPAQRHGLGGELGGIDIRLVIDLGLVDRRTAQEARLVVGMVLDDLESQAHRLAIVACELQEQPVAVVELRAVVGTDMQLLDIRTLEVAGFDGGADLGEGGLDPTNVKVLVLQEAHWAA